MSAQDDMRELNRALRELGAALALAALPLYRTLDHCLGCKIGIDWDAAESCWRERYEQAKAEAA